MADGHLEQLGHGVAECAEVLQAEVMSGVDAQAHLVRMCRGWSVMPPAPAARQIAAAAVTLGLTPALAFLNNATLFRLTLSMVILRRGAAGRRHKGDGGEAA